MARLTEPFAQAGIVFLLAPAQRNGVAEIFSMAKRSFNVAPSTKGVPSVK